MEVGVGMDEEMVVEGMAAGVTTWVAEKGGDATCNDCCMLLLLLL